MIWRSRYGMKEGQGTRRRTKNNYEKAETNFCQRSFHCTIHTLAIDTIEMEFLENHTPL